MEVSIIVPIYNAEEHLEKCLSSILNQSYTNIEVIMIDDGSTDNGIKICEKYCKKDKRFRLVHKCNGGVSSARNLGLKKATGKYITFIDPDDWIEFNMIEKLYHYISMEDIDLAIGGYVKENINTEAVHTIKKQGAIRLDDKDTLNMLLKNDEIGGYLWNKIFKKEIINKDECLTMDEEVHFCEDLLWCCKYIVRCKNIIYDPFPYYHYFINANGICQSNYSQKKLTGLKALEYIIDMLKDKEKIDINEYKERYVYMNISLLMNGLNENKLDIDTYNMLKTNLNKVRYTELKKPYTKCAYITCKFNINLFFSLWKIIK